MPEDIRAAHARELHRMARESEQRAAQCRAGRDRAIRELSADGWSYKQIAAAIGPGCSPELVAAVVKRRVGPGTRARRR